MTRKGKELRDWKGLVAELRSHRAGCWFPHDPEYSWTFGNTVDPHHIVPRRGQRFDDRRNIVRLCRLCHQRAHGGLILVGGVRYEQITTEQIMRLKKLVDGSFYDEEFLDELRGKR